MTNRTLTQDEGTRLYERITIVRPKPPRRDSADGTFTPPLPARHTSQTCSLCGETNPANRVNRDTFRCTGRQYERDADVNAAESIRRRDITLAKADDSPGRATRDPQGQEAKEDPKDPRLR